MREIILDEAKCAEALIAGNDVLDDTRSTLSLIARYDMQAVGMDAGSTSAHLHDYADKHYRELSLHYLDSYITYCVEHATEFPLTAIEYVPITATELSAIAELETTRLQCIAFSALALAKYDTMRYPDVNYWLGGDKWGEIARRANVTISDRDLAYEFHKLYANNMIGLAKRVDNCSLHILYAQPFDAEDVAMRLVDQDYKDLGYTLRAYWGEPFIRCGECERWIKQAKNGRRKFCKDCAADNHNRIKLRSKHRLGNKT